MTEHFIVYSTVDGTEIVRGSGPEGTLALQKPGPGRSVLQVPDEIFNLGVTASEMPVERLAPYVWERVKNERDDRINGGVTTSFGVVDSDAVARLNIAGAVQAAVIAKNAGDATYAVDWTMHDNSAVRLTAEAMIEVGLSVTRHISGCHDHAREIRDAIGAAATASELLMIDLTTGWPSVEPETAAQAEAEAMAPLTPAPPAEAGEEAGGAAEDGAPGDGAATVDGGEQGSADGSDGGGAGTETA